MPAMVSDKHSAKCEVGYELSLTSDNLKAFLRLDAKRFSSKIISAEKILKNLEAANIVHGILHDNIQKIAAERIFDKNILVATGTPPIPGKSANFSICFETARKIVPKQDEDGRINYKDMDFLLNAEVGQVLVRKNSASEGIPGMSVTGQEISARPGNDKKIPVGMNTHLSEDGMELMASSGGTIVYAGSVVSVQPMTTISGSIDLSTGNINCTGSLRVLGDVTSNMAVNVEGDLEILGNVEDARIYCKGNVSIKGGFTGRGDGTINARGNVTLKYIINQTIISGGNVIVGGESVNGNIVAKDQITFLGVNGKIVGGKLSADKLIYAATLGADSEIKTSLRVAYNAKLMEDIKALNVEHERLTADGERVKEALVSLYKLKLADRLTDDKSAVLKKLETFKANLPAQLEEILAQIQKLEQIANECRQARVVAEKQLYSGVQVQIGTKYFQSDSQRGPTIFELYGDKVLPSTFDKAAYEAKQREMKVREALEEMAEAED